MNKKTSFHLIVKVSISLLLFSFLILIVFQLPQASTVGTISEAKMAEGSVLEPKLMDSASIIISSTNSNSSNTLYSNPVT